MKHLLTIAGSDSSGGAGIQADLKAFAAHGVFGMSVITAVTAQNTCGVTAVQDITPEIITAQIRVQRHTGRCCKNWYGLTSGKYSCHCRGPEEVETAGSGSRPRYDIEKRISVVAAGSLRCFD